jgi:hypothetical protein
MLLRAKGTFKVTVDSIRIVTDIDFCKFYRWLFVRAHYFTKNIQIPKHGAHSTVISPKIHKVDCTKYLRLNNQAVWFEYDILGNYGGYSKGFLNFWLDISCPDAEAILDDYGFKKQGGFSRLHVTIGNSKNLS